ncbi:uncharacterized protein RJT20DRAFT_147793 [Scheffersomyces xylosifermentans]|uniref:uncharacterized protein n=1 Tax=Scheffersomyces xylosifermentans TaxID=1304137 RepID=UPI00315D5A01
MQTFGHRDLILYFLIASVFVLKDHGVQQYLKLLVQNSCFLCIQLPFAFLSKRYLNAFPYQSNFSQRATDFEFIVVEVLKYGFRFLQHHHVAKVFFDGRVFEILNRIRGLREYNDGLGDVVHTNFKSEQEETEDLKGIWIYSKSRVNTQPHDVLVLYIHGGPGFGMGNAHMYSEYLSIFTLNLLEQGFNNPGIFAPEFPLDRFDSYPHQMCTILRSYEYLISISPPATHIVVAGDSTGATLALSLLLNLAKPSPNDTNIPLTGKDDYLTVPIVKAWGNEYIDDTDQFHAEVNYYDPGQLRDKEWWAKASPVYGLLVSYGTEELLEADTTSFTNTLKEAGVKVRVDRQNAQVHNWAILNFYTERLIDHREESLQIYAAVVSRMLLWNTNSYFSPDAKHPTRIITIDEDHT